MFKRIDSGRQGAQPSDDGCLPVFIGLLVGGSLLLASLGYGAAHLVHWI